MKGSKQINVEATNVVTKVLKTKRSLQSVLTTLEAKSLSRLDCEMIVRMAKFNVEDKITLAMEGEVIFQDVKVELSKVDNAITYVKASTSCLELKVNIVNV